MRKTIAKLLRFPRKRILRFAATPEVLERIEALGSDRTQVFRRALGLYDFVQTEHGGRVYVADPEVEQDPDNPTVFAQIMGVGLGE